MLLPQFVLFAFLASRAVPPVTLDQLVKEYERFELPFPPAGSKFIIYEWGYDHDELSSGGPVRIKRGYAILAKPKTKLDPFAAIYRGARTDELPLSFRVRVVPPVPDSLGHFKEVDRNDLITAIQCQKLGHKDLAQHLFECYERQRKSDLEDQIHLEHPSIALRDEIYGYWSEQITNPNVDRGLILKHLKTYERDYSKKKFPTDSTLTQFLELGLASRTAKPGSIESLFDDLVNESIVVERHIKSVTSQKLLHRGFEAVPILISHLDDGRLTRCRSSGFFRTHMTVGKVCGMLLDDLAGVRLPRVGLTEEEMAFRQYAPPGMMFHLHFSAADRTRPLKRDAVDDWWKQAFTRNEKDYLLDHLYRIPRGQFEVEGDIRYPNASILMMLAARYPGELKDVYLKAMEHEKPTDTHAISEAIVRSKLEKRTKRAIVEHGLTHREFRHRSAADDALATLEPEEYTKRLLSLIERTPIADESDPSKSFENRLAIMSYRVRDPAIWPALEKAIRRSPVRLRFELLSDLSIFNAEGESFRRERVRTLSAFLDDAACRSPEDVADSRPHQIRYCYNDLELRNFAAIQLSPYFLDYIEYDEHRSNDEWAYLRKWLKEEAEKELK